MLKPQPTRSKPANACWSQISTVNTSEALQIKLRTIFRWNGVRHRQLTVWLIFRLFWYTKEKLIRIFILFSLSRNKKQQLLLFYHASKCFLSFFSFEFYTYIWPCTSAIFPNIRHYIHSFTQVIWYDIFLLLFFSFISCPFAGGHFRSFTPHYNEDEPRKNVCCILCPLGIRSVVCVCVCVLHCNTTNSNTHTNKNEEKKSLFTILFITMTAGIIRTYPHLELSENKNFFHCGVHNFLFAVSVCLVLVIVIVVIMKQYKTTFICMYFPFLCCCCCCCSTAYQIPMLTLSQRSNNLQASDILGCENKNHN